MTATIKDESELPTRVGRTPAHLPPVQWFLRSKSCPTVLIEYHDGATFTRADGKNWKHPAYERTRKILFENGVRSAGPWTEFTTKGGYCDGAIYPYSDEKARAA